MSRLPFSLFWYTSPHSCIRVKDPRMLELPRRPSKSLQPAYQVSLQYEPSRVWPPKMIIRPFQVTCEWPRLGLSQHNLFTICDTHLGGGRGVSEILGAFQCSCQRSLLSKKSHKTEHTWEKESLDHTIDSPPLSTSRICGTATYCPRVSHPPVTTIWAESLRGSRITEEAKPRWLEWESKEYSRVQKHWANLRPREGVFPLRARATNAAHSN